MKKILMYVAALAVAIAPAAFGLWGNASFAQSVALRAPSSATITSTQSRVGDDHGRHRATDDKGGRRGGHGADDGVAHHRSGDDSTGHQRGGADDKAGHRGGDDKAGHHRGGADDNAGHRGGDDKAGHHRGGAGDKGGHHGGDDRGSGGHGSDD